MRPTSSFLKGLNDMEALLECCCGIDLHKDSIVACLLTGAAKDAPDVHMHTFGTTHEDILALAVWLNSHACMHVAMESTGAYWTPLYNQLTQMGAICAVVNARRIKNVPGRKTDWNDAQWIAHLYRHGLLQASFVPARSLQILRNYTRSLETLTQDCSREKNRIEKLLQMEGFKLSSVLTDIFSVTGRHLLDALAANGRITLQDVHKYRDPKCKHSAQAIAKALCGNLPVELQSLLAFKLRQIDEYDRQRAQLEKMIEALVSPFEGAISIADSVPGVGRQSAIDIIAEMGVDMNVFHSAEQLASWAGLTPRNAQSAGKKSPLASCPATNT